MKPCSGCGHEARFHGVGCLLCYCPAYSRTDDLMAVADALQA